MTISYNPTFAGINNIGDPLIMNELDNNYKSFLDWGFLNIGGFVNVTRSTQNIYGFNLHILKPTKDPNRANNTVWQAPRKDWVYESGISFSGTSPINMSGVYVNNAFYPAPTGDSSVGYKINYPEGKIIFNNPLAPNAVVEANYSYRSVQVYKMDQFPYWREIQDRSLENSTGFVLSDKGDFSMGSEYRVQLPAIIIEGTSRSKSKPYRLGDKSLMIEQDILLHVLSDKVIDKNNIVDIIKIQEDRDIWMYNTSTVVNSGVYPLNYDGTKNLTGQNYDIITNNTNYRWLTCTISNVGVSDIGFSNISIYGSIVRVSNQVIIYMSS